MRRILLFLAMLAVSTLAFQGFQCSSVNMTTAKVAVNSKDYPKAIDFLQKELKVNPKNEEAYGMLGAIYYELKNYELSYENFQKAIENSKSEESKKKHQSALSQIWVNCYNEGVNHFNNYDANRSNKHYLDSAYKSFDIGMKINPNILDFYKFKAMISEIKGDTAKAMDFYTQYANRIKPEIDLAKEKGFFIDMDRDKFKQVINDKPKKSIGKFVQELYDSNYVDIYTVNGKDLYTYFKLNDNGDKKLLSWDYDPSPTASEIEKESFFSFSTDVFGKLSNYYYQKKDLTNALKYIDMMSVLEPNNTDIQQSKLSLYQEMGKSDVALREVETLIKNEPNNKANWLQLGDLQQNMKNYDESIKAYEKALEIDPDYDYALRNYASALKNKASVIQKAQQERAEKDKAYKPNTDEYFPLLSKSADNFSKAMGSSAFQSDYQALSDLANIYMVLGNDVELKKTIRSLELMETKLEKNQLERYYYSLLNVYSFVKDEAKLKQIEQKINNLK